VIDVAWNIDDDDRDVEFTGTPRPLLGTWHFLRNSLRREWRTWVGLAGLGAVLGMASLVLLPPSSTGTVTLLMAHPANLEGPAAMATDVSLLNTREVAVRTVRELGLDLSPDAFQSTISAEPVTTQILTITVSGPNDASAVARADALVTQYLDFRATQMSSLTSGLVSGYNTRIGQMKERVNDLTRQYSQLSEQGATDRASEVLTQRAVLNSQITTMQRAIEDSTLQTDAAITSTHVVDPARALRHSAKKAMVLDVGSGLIGGAALGVGFVLFRALTSDRLRRRQDVALALGAPVRFSVASPGPPERRLKRLRERLRARVPWRGAAARRGAWRGRDLEALVYGLESAVMSPAATPGSAKPVRTNGSTATATSAGATSSRPAKATSAASPSARKTASARATVPDRSGSPTARQAAQSQQAKQSGDGGVTDEATGALEGSRSPSRAATDQRSGPPKGVALAALGNARVAAAVIDALATHLRGLGRSVFLLDLTASGALVTHLSPAGAPTDRADSTEQAQIAGARGDGRSGPATGVFQPTGVPGLARGPRGANPGAVIDLPVGDAWRGVWDAADVVLALVQVDPGIDVENLRSWVDQVVPLVTAGRSTVELLETTAELIRAAGLSLPFAMMVGSDDTDESLGLLGPEDPNLPPQTSQR
jgi:capsular polysaccharide biosynthesis protein